MKEEDISPLVRNLIEVNRHRSKRRKPNNIYPAFQEPIIPIAGEAKLKPDQFINPQGQLVQLGRHGASTQNVPRKNTSQNNKIDE